MYSVVSGVSSWDMYLAETLLDTELEYFRLEVFFNPSCFSKGGFYGF